MKTFSSELLEVLATDAGEVSIITRYNRKDGTQIWMTPAEAREVAAALEKAAEAAEVP